MLIVLLEMVQVLMAMNVAVFGGGFVVVVVLFFVEVLLSMVAVMLVL